MHVATAEPGERDHAPVTFGRRANPLVRRRRLDSHRRLSSRRPHLHEGGDRHRQPEGKHLVAGRDVDGDSAFEHDRVHRVVGGVRGGVEPGTIATTTRHHVDDHPARALVPWR